MFPTEYSQLSAMEYKGKGDFCKSCEVDFEYGTLLFKANKDKFHYFCLFSDANFTGKIEEIGGFDEISREHRDLLRSNVTDDNESDHCEFSDSEDFVLAESDDEQNYSTAASATTTLAPRNEEPKSKDKLKYETMLERMCGEGCSNPEPLWAYKVCDNDKTQVIKYGYKLDKEFDSAKKCHFASTEKGDIYAVTLCLCDIRQTRNTYFKIHLYRDDCVEKYYLFRSWGQIGTLRGAVFTESFISKEEAVAEFEHTVYSDFQALTANSWRNRHFFVHRENYMAMIDIDLSADTLTSTDSGELALGLSSQLSYGVKSVLLSIFGAKNIAKAVDESINVETSPLGKITAKQISIASNLLKRVIEESDSPTQGDSDNQKPDRIRMKNFNDRIVKLSNDFYSAFPQSFGHLPPIIINKHTSDKLSWMLDGLLDIHFVCNILQEIQKEAGKSGIDPLDLQYARLNTNMTVVPEGSDDFMMINQYIQNGLGHTHYYKKITMTDLIKLDRYGESSRFKADLGNRKLLWHGSCLQNFPGILTHGLKIAPPDAVQTGHAFGRGVYFADMISKSANYCRSKAVGYLLLCDVALGKSKELTYGTFAGLNPGSYHSIKGVGLTSPDPSGDYHHPDGYTIPLGSVTNKSGFFARWGRRLDYNEYVVYNTDQIRFRYLVQVQFN